MTTALIVEADGGSRGNPGPAAYGAVIKDAHTGTVLATEGRAIGIATNNVAEYRGLIAGFELARNIAPDAAVEVRMDSKLVIEQMAGRWKIKHPDMRELALRARDIAPATVQFSWIPREQNTAADALVNAALDGGPTDYRLEGPLEDEPNEDATTGWTGASSTAATTLVLVRHGATDFTLRKVFSGSGGDDPELNATGWQQAGRAADFAHDRYNLDAVITSPLARSHQTAQVLSDRLGLPMLVDERLREANFGDWDGQTFAEINQKWPAELKAWLSSSAVAPPGGESFDAVYERTMEARNAVLADFAGQTVAVVSHVGVIKMVVRAALGAPIESIYRMELAPASFSTVQFWPDGNSSLREFSVVP